MLEVVINALQAAFWVAAGGRSFLPPTNLLPPFRPTSRDYSQTMCAPHLYVSTILHFYKRQCWIYILHPVSLWTGNKNGVFFWDPSKGSLHCIVGWGAQTLLKLKCVSWQKSTIDITFKVMVMMMVVVIMMVLIMLIMLRVIMIMLKCMRTEEAPRLRKVSLKRHMESKWGVAKKQKL